MPDDAAFDPNDPSRIFIQRTLHLQRSRRLASHTYAKLLAAEGFRIGPAKIRLQNTSLPLARCTRVSIDQAVAASRVFGVPLAFLVGLEPCGQCEDDPPAGFTCAACGLPGAGAEAEPACSECGGRPKRGLIQSEDGQSWQCEGCYHDLSNGLVADRSEP